MNCVRFEIEFKLKIVGAGFDDEVEFLKTACLADELFALDDVSVVFGCKSEDNRDVTVSQPLEELEHLLGLREVEP